MDRRTFLKASSKSIIGAVVGSSCVNYLSCDISRKPNIILFLVDDMGWSDLGCFGSQYYETPNIDKLAKEGIKFTNAYANAPNCAPTRACLLSGQYTPRHGVYTVNDPVRGKLEDRKLVPPENRRILLSEKITIAEALKKGGYVSASMGKWHMGDPPELGPKAQGFDVNIAGDHHGHPPAGYFSPYELPNLKNAPKGEYLTDRLTEEAIQFIENNKDAPFFLYLPFYTVHTPIQAKKNLIEKFKAKPGSSGQNNPEYAAMIASLDAGVGRILQKADELGLTENTFVLLSSDNGGVGGYEDLDIPINDITSNAPLRGGKGMLYEGGIRVPMIVRWPGFVKPGQVTDVPVISTDFYPTLLDVAGVDAPANYPMDGESLLPIIKNGSTLNRNAIFWHFPAYLQAGGTRELRTTPAGAIRRGNYKLIEFFEDGRLELYDLQNDIGETKNLAEELPEKTKELHNELKNWRQSLNADMPKPNPGYKG